MARKKPSYKYGTGRRPTSPKFVEYMEWLVKQLPYSTMPAIYDKRGKINWQVSSGTGTSFFEHYNARVEWWICQADKLGIPGAGKGDARFSIAARLMHPTGKRPCRICGVERSIFYSYVGKLLAKAWNKKVPGLDLVPRPPITIADAASRLRAKIGEKAALRIIEQTFRLPVGSLRTWSEIPDALDRVKLGQARVLSPGFMANPPDRLDGFHDMAICCRESSDPGRSVENLKSYLNDRRAFMWWSNGDWLAADALFNAAVAGSCRRCTKKVERISPDHVGPLSCGFLHRPAFVALCQSCNSAKQRRLSLQDVQSLIADEKLGQDIVGWQVKRLWDLEKDRVTSDADALWLSNKMRAAQHQFLLDLREIVRLGWPHFLLQFLPYQYAFQQAELINFDPVAFTGEVRVSPVESRYKWSKARRVVRIAFEELEFYVAKAGSRRKILGVPEVEPDVDEVVHAIPPSMKAENKLWVQALAITVREKREERVEELLRRDQELYRTDYAEATRLIRAHFDGIGTALAKLPNKLFTLEYDE